MDYIDFHRHSMKHTNEKAIGGIVEGLIDKDETVTWEAKHFGIKQTLTSVISEFDYGNNFTDVMIKGPFKSITHQHIFRFTMGKTMMQDRFSYEIPFGFLGRLFDYLFLNIYLKKLLVRRNLALKNAAESEEWRQFLKQIS